MRRPHLRPVKRRRWISALSAVALDVTVALGEVGGQGGQVQRRGRGGGAALPSAGWPQSPLPRRPSPSAPSAEPVLLARPRGKEHRRRCRRAGTRSLRPRASAALVNGPAPRGSHSLGRRPVRQRGSLCPAQDHPLPPLCALWAGPPAPARREALGWEKVGHPCAPGWAAGLPRL